MFYFIIQIILMILLAPLLNGIIKKIKALSQKRVGAPIFQLYKDIFKLLKKSSVVSTNSSFIYRVTPYIVLSSTLAAGLLVPITTKITPSIILGDIIVFISLLALSRFFMVLSGLDTASTFGGMGSSREIMISCLIEPSIMVSLFSIALLNKTTSISEIMLNMQKQNLFSPIYFMIALSFMIIIIAETCRIPVDDPATHLELTMVHEAMILEYSGRHLAFMELAASVKGFVLSTLFVNIFFPHEFLVSTLSYPINILISISIYVLKIILITIVIGLVEIYTVKFKLFSIPNIAAISFILAFLGFLQYFII